MANERPEAKQVSGGSGERSLRSDAVAGVVLGVQSVPDGLATGLLAGVNPLAGLYGYMVGTLGGALDDQLDVHGRAGHRRHGHADR